MILAVAVLTILVIYRQSVVLVRVVVYLRVVVWVHVVVVQI